MISRQVWLKTLIAILLSVLLAYYVNRFFTNMTEKVEVIVAAEDIPAQTRIEKSMLKTIKVTAEDRSRLVPDALLQMQDAIGSVTVEMLKKGDILRDTAGTLVPVGSTVQISNKQDLPKAFFIPADQRAITLKIDAEGALGFTLKSGDKVDVIFTSMSGETGGAYSNTILRDITIFELSEISDKDRQSSANLVTQNITLLVSPKQAEKLALAKRKGKIDLLLTSTKPDTENWNTLKPVYPSDFTVQGAGQS